MVENKEIERNFTYFLSYLTLSILLRIYEGIPLHTQSSVGFGFQS